WPERQRRLHFRWCRDGWFRKQLAHVGAKVAEERVVAQESIGHQPTRILGQRPPKNVAPFLLACLATGPKVPEDQPRLEEARVAREDLPGRPLGLVGPSVPPDGLETRQQNCHVARAFLEEAPGRAQALVERAVAKLPTDGRDGQNRRHVAGRL